MVKTEEIIEGWVDDWQIRNKKDCHVSSSVHVIKTDDIIKLIKYFHYDWQRLRIGSKKLSKDQIIDKASFLILVKEDLIEAMNKFKRK